MGIEILKKENGKYAIMLDGIFSCEITEETFYKFNLYEKENITKEEIKEIKKVESIKNAKSDGFKFIAYKMRTEYEVRNKLLENGYNTKIIDQAISFFIDLNYLNDNDYVHKFINESRKLKIKSKSKLEYELRNKGIEKTIIALVLNDYNFEEYNDALFLITKKIKNLSTFSDTKIINFLKYRGYSNDIIIKILNNFKKE